MKYTAFENKTTEIDFEALVRKFWFENNPLYGNLFLVDVKLVDVNTLPAALVSKDMIKLQGQRKLLKSGGATASLMDYIIKPTEQEHTII